MNILVIDDDSAMTDLLTLLLQSVASNFYTANSGNEGIRLAKEFPPQLIILDLMMPDMAGWEVCSAIRKFNSNPILVVSAMDDPSVIAKVLNAGADDYLIKPVTKSILMACVNKFTRRLSGELGGIEKRQPPIIGNSQQPHPSRTGI
jgi:DNA-binding response OmpR family regulator